MGHKQQSTAPESEVAKTGYGLTPAERRVVRCLCDGMRNIDIGKALGITQNTVRHHIWTLCDKLGTSNRHEVVIFAFTKGLVSLNTARDSAQQETLDKLEEIHQRIERDVRRSRLLVQRLVKEAL